jgi:hypothetical protein
MRSALLGFLCGIASAALAGCLGLILYGLVYALGRL